MGLPQGVRYLNAWEMGDKLTLKQAVLAKCADCMGKYADGMIDCEIPECPLYAFAPYGAMWRGREKKTISEGLRRYVSKKQKGVSVGKDGGAK